MKTSNLNNFNTYELPKTSTRCIQGGATEELFGAYHFLLENSGD